LAATAITTCGGTAIIITWIMIIIKPMINNISELQHLLWFFLLM
jgi:hypothetical protein